MMHSSATLRRPTTPTQLAPSTSARRLDSTPYRYLQHYDVMDARYGSACAAFLSLTDQVMRRTDEVGALVGRLPKRQRFVDVGAGTGVVTSRLGQAFAETLAIEPNAVLAAFARQALHGLATARVLPHTLEQATQLVDSESVDLVLCSHVLYYIEESQWLRQVEAMARWLAPGGKLVLVLAQPQSPEMLICREFYDADFRLENLADEVTSTLSGAFTATLRRSESLLRVPDGIQARRVAEFLLNPPYLGTSPLPTAVQRFVQLDLTSDGLQRSHRCEEATLVITRRHS